MISSYEHMFGCKPKQNVLSPLDKGDCPELNMSDPLEGDPIQQYQSLVGAMQWAESIGRFDITTVVMTYGFLAKMKHAIIRVWTEDPDY